MNLTPKERGATDLIDLTAEEQRELLGSVRGYLALAQKYPHELLMKAIFEAVSESFPELPGLPLEQRGEMLRHAVNYGASQMMQIGHSCLMPDCDCGS
ncbi:MAG TPA: hypothetical protein VGB07_36245 [Blastocatellia bacterium]